MEHWNKGGLSREEFLHMREDAMRKLQELAKRQTSHPRMPAAASSPPNSTRPHLQKPEAASSPPVLKEPLTKLESKPLLDAVPAKNGGEDRPAYTQPLPSGLSAAEKTGDDPASAADPVLNSVRERTKESDAETLSYSPHAVPPKAAQGDQPEGFIPSEDLLKTIQDISQSQALESTVFPHEDPPDAFAPDNKEKPLEKTSNQSVPEPSAAQTISAEPIFVPPLPYHPDGFIPRRPGRGPSFHPDAVCPEKGCYQPPRPHEKPPYRPENRWKEVNDKKK